MNCFGSFVAGVWITIFVYAFVLSYFVQDKGCDGYNKEVQRIEIQAKEYQERFDKWCLTQKHRCKI